LSVLAVLPLLLIASSVFRKGVKKSFNQVRDAVAKLNIYIQERLSGMYLIKLYNVSEREMNTFKRLNAVHRDANIKTIFYYSVFFPVMDVLTSVSFALLMFIGFELNDTGSVGLGDLTFFIMMAQMLFRPIRMLADRLNTLQMGIVSAGRVYDLLDDRQKIEKSGTLNLPDSIENITFRNVSFSYVSEHAVLKNIHFHLEKGKKLAVIGETGSGKSTIAQLLCGMYDGYDGEILLNNIELKNFNKNQLRKKIFIVLQDVFLFNDTLFENIRFYDPKISRELVEQAVNDLQLNDFISGFPEGLDYVIKERGSGLSSGQKQLVAFLRAKLLNPDVFILDEATSFLDAQTEKQIQKAMNHILKNKTAIIIAHRLSTLMECDDVLALSKGVVVEYGKIQDMMKNEHSVFRKYLDLQTEYAV
jgi:ABC-type multidrug transport system fused ATPase/permease subunit